jgi:hypothetical protein
MVTIYRPCDIGQEVDQCVTMHCAVMVGLQRFAWQHGYTVRDIFSSSQLVVEYYNYWQQCSGRKWRRDINWDFSQVIRREHETLQMRTVSFSLGAAVLNENTMPWKPGMSLGDLLELAGVTPVADLGKTHILRAGGPVVDALQRPSLLGLGRGIRGERMQPCDTLIVPECADRETLYTRSIRGAKGIFQIFYQIGLGAAALQTLLN